MSPDRDVPGDTSEERLARLRILTETVRPYAEMFGARTRDQVLLNLTEGRGFVVGLLKSVRVAVLNLHYDPHSKFTSHTHDQEEFVVVYVGHFFMDIGGVVTRVEAGQVIHIPAGIIHDAWTKEEGCDQIVITVPANPEFPDVR